MSFKEVFDTVVARIQFDYEGRLRILLTVEEVVPEGGKFRDGARYEEKTYMGGWAHYRGIATLTYQGKTYIAATEYGLLPKAETVYHLSEDGLNTTLDRSMEYIDAQGKDHSAECCRCEEDITTNCAVHQHG